MRHKELFKEEIIHQLELHPSRLDKEKIISEAMERGLDDFFEGIRMALDPLVTFGVKIVPEKDNEKSQNFLWKDFRALANKLIQRELTGHAARDAILTAMESTKKFIFIIRFILKHHLRFFIEQVFSILHFYFLCSFLKSN